MGKCVGFVMWVMVVLMVVGGLVGCGGEGMEGDVPAGGVPPGEGAEAAAVFLVIGFLVGLFLGVVLVLRYGGVRSDE